MDNSKIVVILAVLFGLSAGAYLAVKANKNRAPIQVQLDLALDRLLKESPRDSIHFQVIKNKAKTLKIEAGPVGNGIGATTTVSEDGDITIRVDVDEVNSVHDRLEPVIAHEIYHAVDALEITCPLNWIKEANEEEHIQPWYRRPIEQRAIQSEDETREYLLRHYPAEYKGMFPTRLTQNKH